MSGLSYLCEYGEETDSEEEYCSKENHNKKNTPKLRLPPPNLSGVSVVPFEEHIDNPSLHGGRQRTFQHVRGNWATFIYIEYPNKESLEKVVNELALLVSTVTSSNCIGDDIHISLSKTFVLKYHMITAFTSSLQEALNNIESFTLGFQSVEVYCNEDKTRTFLALKVDSCTQRHLINITNQIDNILEDFRLPKFYDEPSFHMSVISIIGNKEQELLSILTKLNETFLHQEEQTLGSVVISKVNCKSGNKFYQYYLN